MADDDLTGGADPTARLWAGILGVEELQFTEGLIVDGVYVDAQAASHLGPILSPPTAPGSLGDVRRYSGLPR